jgi:hypothetical protein
MRINVMGCGTVGGAQEFLLRKLGHEVLAFVPYVFPEIKSPEKDGDMNTTPRGITAESQGLNPMLFESVRKYNLRIKNRHDNT